MIDNSRFLSPEVRPTPLTAAEVLAMTESNRAQEALTVLAQSRGAIGLTDAQILLALARGTDNWDPFGITLTFIGNMTRFFGSTITCVVTLFSLYLFASWVRDKVRDFASWLGTWVTNVIPGASFLLSAGKAIGILDESSTSSRATQLAGASFQGLITSFMPGPVAAILPTMMSDFLGGGVGNLASLNTGGGGNPAGSGSGTYSTAMSLPPGIAGFAASNPIASQPAPRNTASNSNSNSGLDNLLASAGTALGAGAASLLGNIFGITDGEVSEADVQAVARATGADPTRVRALLNL